MVEFVSYDGAYPNLCTGQLVLKINGQVREFSRHCLQSGGTVWFDNDWNAHIENGRWSIDPRPHPPEDLEPLRKEIEECINENIPHGCCGGCV